MASPLSCYLVGDVHNGIAQMFTVIENARMTIGVKAAGTLSTGYLNALAFAKERPGRRPSDDRQGGAAGNDHPPPRCAPQFDDAEGVR
jgi:alkylation response protein AidB-like acyl-CoA dehydrogenase